MKKSVFFLFVFSSLLPFYVAAQNAFKTPPSEIMELADVEAPAVFSLSSNNKYLASLNRSLYKSLDELAERELRIGGLRINPLIFNESRGRYYNNIRLQKLDDTSRIDIKGLPSELKIQAFSFSPDEKMCAFVNVEAEKMALWVIDLAKQTAFCLLDKGVSSVMGNTYEWGKTSDEIFCRFHTSEPNFIYGNIIVNGPSVQDASGSAAPARTYQDLLRNPQDEIVFDHFAQCSVLRLQTNGAKPTEVLPKAVYKNFSISPNGKFILSEVLQKPYSYTLTYRSFPSQTNIHSVFGEFICNFHQRPLQDQIPISFDAVENGKRYIDWRSDMPATLVWCQALDGGNPSVDAEYRDELFQSSFPFNEAQSLFKLKNRLIELFFCENGCIIAIDAWRKNRNTKTYYYNAQSAQPKVVVLFDRSSEDLYSDPGNFVTLSNQFNREILKVGNGGKTVYMIGEGFSPQGNRPFLDELDLSTGKTVRLWQAEGKNNYERIVRISEGNGKEMITSVESPTSYPNLYLRNIGSTVAPKQLTFRTNPYKSFENVIKKKIHYKRADGVMLSANLYLPAGYDKMRDGRLPLLLEAYPTEYKDEIAAGQIKESPYSFMSINWSSPLFWVMRGFAVLEKAQFPIIGKGEVEPNDTYIEQLVANAAAAINAVDSMGVVDTKRCAVMGHSYGAFMTANLLAHSNLFAAGIARSGAYNRTLTPFGFQSEERTYWQAKEVYDRMSPFTYADKIKSPILLIHGDADNNPGTFTLQSERLFHAIKGNGGIARLVLLPYESHSYAARENILHMLWEMDNWLSKYVKDVK